MNLLNMLLTDPVVIFAFTHFAIVLGILQLLCLLLPQKY